MEWNDIEKLAHWVLRKKFSITDTDELIGECFLCFMDCLPRYKPEYSNFATFYRTSLEGWLKDYLTYNSHTKAKTGYRFISCFQPLPARF